ncbi:SGNH/GDSL hydrolase family protein [Spirosoma fluminis]
MNVLVIGDGHTYGYGLSSGQLSYVGHFSRQMSRPGRAMSVEAYAHLTPAQVLATLDRLPLNQYDLIVLQLEYWMGQPSMRYLPLPRLGQNATSPKQHWAGRAMQRLREWTTIGIQALTRPRSRSLFVSTLLKTLRPYRHHVLLLTPLPHRDPVQAWLRRRCRSLLLRKAGDQLFSVFDSSSVLLPHDEYFLPDDATHLNAVSHELLGRALFDFYQSAPTIVTIQAVRRNGDDQWSTRNDSL